MSKLKPRTDGRADVYLTTGLTQDLANQLITALAVAEAATLHECMLASDGSTIHHRGNSKQGRVESVMHSTVIRNGDIASMLVTMPHGPSKTFNLCVPAGAAPAILADASSIDAARLATRAAIAICRIHMEAAAVLLMEDPEERGYPGDVAALSQLAAIAVARSSFKRGIATVILANPWALTQVSTKLVAPNLLTPAQAQEMSPVTAIEIALDEDTVTIRPRCLIVDSSDPIERLRLVSTEPDLYALQRQRKHRVPGKAKP